MKKTDTPIRGAAILTSKSELFLLAVRLPPDLTDLAPVIIQQVERDAAALPH